MRSLGVLNLRLFLVALIFVLPVAAQAPAGDDKPLADAQELFRTADFRGAAAAFKKIIEAKPSPEAFSGMVRSLLKADDVKAADDASQKAMVAFAESALVHAARGDVYFRRGMIPEAEGEYKAALKLNDQTARAWLGQGRVDAVYTRYSSSNTAITKARDLDPEDGDALYEWAIRRHYPDNVAALEKHMAEHRNDEEEERHEREYIEFLKALAGRKVWIQSHDVDHTELKLESLTIGASLTRRGYGLRVRLNDRANVTLLLDTGTSGVVITRKLAEKIKAQKLSEHGIEGVGKSGPARGYRAMVDKITIGELEFNDCFIDVTPREIAEVDGLIGTEIFSKYLVTLDTAKSKLRLDPLPAAPERGSLPPEPYTQAFTFGHILLVSTDVGKKSVGLFVVDTGANTNTISPEQAKLVPQMRAYNVPVSGVSGTTTSAFIAEDTTLHFGNVHPSGERLSSVDLHTISKNLGVEVSGQIGFSAMQGMKVIIDYRDGLVQFAK